MFLKSFQFSPWSVMRTNNNLHTITITKVNNVRMECLVRKRCLSMEFWRWWWAFRFWWWSFYTSADAWRKNCLFEFSIAPIPWHRIAVCISLGAKRVVNVHRTRTMIAFNFGRLLSYYTLHQIVDGWTYVRFKMGKIFQWKRKICFLVFVKFLFDFFVLFFFSVPKRKPIYRNTN